MSDFGDPGTGSIPLDGGGEFTPSVGDPGQQTTQPHPDSLYDGFLKGIPDADRNVVAQYVKNWDAGVTKRFQAIHEQYKPYKELGDVETIKGAMAVYKLIDEDPQRVYDFLAQQLQQTRGGQSGVTPQVPGQQTAPAQPPVNPAFADLPEAFVADYQQQQQMLMALAQRFLAQEKMQQTQQQQAAEDAKLTQTMDGLRQKYGDFDEMGVLARMMNAGMTPDQAVQDWQQMMQQQFGQLTRRPQPMPLSGGGGVPNRNVDPTQMSKRDANQLVVQMLANAREQERQP